MKMAVLDANVLYPAPVRDYLLHLAEQSLYFPKWTDDIHDEWIRNLIRQRKDISIQSLLSAKNAMTDAFPDANIIHYKHKIRDLDLPDREDRHVLAAAIIANAQDIVTFNVRDFPAEKIERFGIRSTHPDIFIVELIQQHQQKCFDALKTQSSRLKHPPKGINDVLSILKKCGLSKSMERLTLFNQNKSSNVLNVELLRPKLKSVQLTSLTNLPTFNIVLH